MKIIHRVMGVLMTEVCPPDPPRLNRKEWIGANRLQSARDASERARVTWENRKAAREAKRWKRQDDTQPKDAA